MKNITQKLQVGFFFLLPKHLMSRLFGKLSNTCWPTPILHSVIRLFCRFYQVDLKQATRTDFVTFNDFFTRQLKPELRPIDNREEAVISPVDGILGCWGKIEKNLLLQVKGLPYSLEDLLQRKEYINTFTNGYYMTFYLSPRHYHRIHSPIKGQVKELYYIPGDLFPVNSAAVAGIKSLFARNERLLTLMENQEGRKVAVIKVGATNVGRIKVVYDEVQARFNHEVHRQYDSVFLEKGQELGRFEMGSTVILLFENKGCRLLSRNLGHEFKYGEAIGYLSRMA